MTPTSLASLAATANEAHHATVVQAGIAGAALIEAKALVPHGQWAKWIADQCDFSVRTAQAYMQVARNPQTSADSVAQLLKSVAREGFRLRPPQSSDPAPAAQHLAHEWVASHVRALAARVREITPDQAAASMDALTELESAIAAVKAGLR